MACTIPAIGSNVGVGTIYYHMGYGTPRMQKHVGFLAFTLTFLLTSNIEVLSIFLEERSILTRETLRSTYRVSSYVLSSTLVFLLFLFFMAIVTWLVLVTANSFVSFCSALVSDFIIGNTVVTGVMGAFFSFSGYFIAKDYIPKGWLWMHYISLFKYMLDALLINEYLHVVYGCFGPDYGGSCFITEQNVLETMFLDRKSKWVY